MKKAFASNKVLTAVLLVGVIHRSISFLHACEIMSRNPMIGRLFRYLPDSALEFHVSAHMIYSMPESKSRKELKTEDLSL